MARGGITQDGAPTAYRHALAATITRTSRRLFRMSREWGRNDNHPMPFKTPALCLQNPDTLGGIEAHSAEAFTGYVPSADRNPVRYAAARKSGNEGFFPVGHGEA